MSETKLITPGHGIVTDSLIMHGLVRVLAIAGITEGVVERLGDRFVIKFYGDINEVRDRFLRSDVYELFRLKLLMYITKNERVGLIEKLALVNINPSAERNIITKFSDAIYELSPSLYIDEDHKVKMKEGRSTSKTLNTLYLHLGGVYGKYYFELDNISRPEKAYEICNSCYALATLGLLYGAFAVIVEKAGDKYVTLMTIIPENRLNIDEVLTMQRLAESYESYGGSLASDIPTLAVPLYALSVGETLIALSDAAQVLIWKLTKTGNFQRTLDVSTVSLNNVFEFIGKIKYRYPEWPAFVNKCLAVNEDGWTLLAQLSELVLFGGDYYGFIRQLTTYLMNRLKENASCKSFIKNVDDITNAIILSLSHA